MTKDREWGEPLTGPEVKALGLPGDTPVSADDMPRSLRYWALLSDTPFYRLPADHPAYIVHRYNAELGTNFVYWAGGDEAPDDWDGRDVLWEKGLVGLTPKSPAMWPRHYPIDCSEIIGYTKKPQLVTEEASEPEMTVNHAYEARMQEQRRIEPETDTFTPCERTIRMCIDALPHSKRFITAEGYQESVKRRIEALLPKPDRAEELVKAYGEEPAPLDWDKLPGMKVAEDVIRWLIERGEIKG